MVGLCDINPKRVKASKRLMGVDAPTFTELDRMLRETRPETLIVSTKDCTHNEMIIRGLQFGCDVITEKPMTTDEVKCRSILDVEKQCGKKLVTAFNYRFSPRAQKVKELLMANVIGPITSVDFHWYLDIHHGADYFRRWHAYRKNSGTLFVHKATHHFDLVNWYFGVADPVEVSALGELRNYGRNGKFRSRNCRGCPHQKQCRFYWDLTKDSVLKGIYVDCESEDGYLRDACVYRNDIDIYDTMTAQVKYDNGVIMSYSLNAFMPYEGHSMAFNGIDGRLEIRSYERQPWVPASHEEIRLTKSFGRSQLIEVNRAKKGTAADPQMQKMLFHPELPDPYKQRAGSHAGAMSILTGIAAVRSIEQRAGEDCRLAEGVKRSEVTARCGRRGRRRRGFCRPRACRTAPAW